jgi:hypothetical protein
MYVWYCDAARATLWRNAAAAKAGKQSIYRDLAVTWTPGLPLLCVKLCKLQNTRETGIKVQREKSPMIKI